MVTTGQLSKPLLETLPMVFHLQLVRHTSPVFSALAQLICIPQCPDELQRHQCLCGARFPGWPLGVCHAGEAALSLHPLCCAFCLTFPLAVSCHPSISTCFNTYLMHCLLAIMLGTFPLSTAPNDGIGKVACWCAAFPRSPFEG